MFVFPEALSNLWECVDPARADSRLQPTLAELHAKLLPSRRQGVQASTVKLVPKASTVKPKPKEESPVQLVPRGSVAQEPKQLLPKKGPKDLKRPVPAGVHSSRSPKTSTLPELLTKLYSLVFACSDFAYSEMALLVFERSDLLET